MSINSTGNRNQVQPAAYGIDEDNDQYSNGNGAMPPLPPPPPQTGQQAVHMLRIVLLLLAIICLGSLGAVPLATNFLPETFVNPPVPTPSKPHPTPTPAITMPDGECTATPQSMQYVSTAATPTPVPTSTAKKNKAGTSTLPTPTPTIAALPPDWTTAGHTQQDFANAQACAASFVQTYQTVDANDFRTLEASTDMLSSGAKLRFYGRLPSSTPDTRMDPLWRAVIQKQNLKQTARVELPSLLAVRYSNRHLFVWMLVPYHVSLQRNGQMLSLDGQYTVLLADVASQAGGNGTGWQVSGWREGDTAFAVPDPV